MRGFQERKVELNLEAEGVCLHPKSGFPGCPESANYFDFPQSYSVRTRETIKFSLFSLFFSVFLCFSLFFLCFSLCFSLFLLLRLTHFFRKIFWTGEQNPQTFSLFGCLGGSPFYETDWLTHITSWASCDTNRWFCLLQLKHLFCSYWSATFTKYTWF